MFVVRDLGTAILLCVVTMLGWGSWANTQKISAKRNWGFPLYYWDYVIGVFLTGVIFMLTLGGPESIGLEAARNLAAARQDLMVQAAVSGVLFNVSNILLVVAIDAAGMAVAFPVGVGLALVIGTVASYLQAPKGSPVLLFSGVALVVLAMVMSAVARRKLAQTPGKGWLKGVIYAIVAGSLMGFFYPRLAGTISPSFQSEPIQPGFLSPYSALALFGAGVLLSNVVVNTIFLWVNRLSYRRYLTGGVSIHWPGLLGGAIWMIALTANIVASGVAGPAISYALGQGATLVAAIWGVVIWREFRGAQGVAAPLALMFAGYALGLVLIGMATLQ
jgi:glucose uptake protein